MLLKNKYVYVTSNRNVPDVFEEEKPLIYYQICQFPDQVTGRYHMRKIFYNGNNVIVNMINYYLTPEQKNIFYNCKKSYDYKEYPNYDFNDVSLPSGSLLDQARSELFTGKVYGREFKLLYKMKNNIYF